MAYIEILNIAGWSPAGGYSLRCFWGSIASYIDQTRGIIKIPSCSPLMYPEFVLTLKALPHALRVVRGICSTNHHDF